MTGTPVSMMIGDIVSGEGEGERESERVRE